MHPIMDTKADDPSWQSTATRVAFVTGPRLAAFFDQKPNDCQGADAVNPPRADKPLSRKTDNDHE